MRSIWIGFFYSWLVLGSASAMAGQADDAVLPSEIKAAAEAWEDHSNADGTGLAWDLLRAVFEPVGVKLKFSSEPYIRALGLAQRGKVDAVVGLFLHDSEGVEYPRWQYADDAVGVLGLASMPVPTMSDLPSFRLIWVRGYGYQTQYPQLKRYQEVQRRNGIPEMLMQGRADFYIDDDNEIKSLLKVTEHPELLRMSVLQYLPLYVAFAPTARGRALKQLYEQRMDTLAPSGALKPIFQRWQEHYPYATSK
jgi:polar amino acid transport system substrate-binding protein